MDSSAIPAVFQNRHKLQSTPLNKISSRLETADGHHVAKVHGRHGVVSGFTVSVDSAGVLSIGPGQAYSCAGHLISTDQATEFLPPHQLGDYKFWLLHDGTIAVHRSNFSPGGALLLAGADAVESKTSLGAGWDAPSQSGRPRIPQPLSPRVGSGKERLGLSDITIDSDTRTIRRFVSTANASFAETPIYFATIALDRNFRPQDLDNVDGWFTTICSPSPTEFTLTVHVRGTSELFDDLILWQTLSFAGFSPVEFDLVWTGVDPRRPGEQPADLSCSELPTFPSDEPIIF